MCDYRLLFILTLFLLAMATGCESDGSRPSGAIADTTDKTDTNISSTDNSTENSSDESGGDTNNSNDTGEDTNLDWNSCGSADVNFELATPTVLLLIDQSGSMNDSLGSDSRWNTVKKVLVDPADGVVKKLENDVIFGAQLYTSLDGFLNGGTCPMLTGNLPKINNYTEIADIFAKNSPLSNGDTPTGEALHVAASLLKDAPSPKAIVLATDGAPDTCTEPDPWEEEKKLAAKTGVENEAIAAYNSDIAVHVISVGDAASIGLDHLKRLANVGQGYDATDPEIRFYDGKDATALVEAFDKIMAGVRKCVLALEGDADETMVGECRVNVNDSLRTYNDPDGWSLKNSGEIELTGKSCEDIKTGEATVSVRCPCGTITID